MAEHKALRLPLKSREGPRVMLGNKGETRVKVSSQSMRDEGGEREERGG
jgi:hypothetical protein